MTRSVERSEPNTYRLPAGEPIRRALVAAFRVQERAVLQALPKPARKSATIVDPLPDSMPELELGALAMSERMTPLLSVHWEKAGRALYRRLGLDANRWEVVNPFLAASIRKASLAFCESTNATTALKLKTALARSRAELHAGLVTHGESLSELTKRVRAIFSDATRARARRIAQTEAARAVHAATVAAAEASGMVAGFRWLLSSDACPLCHTIARRAGAARLGQAFAVIGNHPDYREIRHPPAHPRCNCTIQEVLRADLAARAGDESPEWAPTLIQPKPEAVDLADTPGPDARPSRSRGRAKPAVPRLGESRASVAFDPDDPDAERTVLAALRRLVGRQVGTADLASLAGAPDASRVFGFTLGEGTRAEVMWRGNVPGVLRFAGRVRHSTLGAVVVNDEIDVQAAQRGRNIGLRLVARQVEAMARLGIARAELLAARFDDPNPDFAMTGYRAWPSLGYDAPIPPELRPGLPDALRSAGTIIDLYQTPEGRAWWRERGISTHMTFDATPNSRSRRVLEARLIAAGERDQARQQLALPLGPDGDDEESKSRSLDWLPTLPDRPRVELDLDATEWAEFESLCDRVFRAI